MENETLHFSILISEGPLRIHVNIRYLEYAAEVLENAEIHTIEKGAVEKFARGTGLVKRNKHTIFPSCNLICT